MALPAERVRASKGAYLSSMCCMAPKPVYAAPVDAAASVADGKLVLKADDAEAWSFELFKDAEFVDCEETVDGAAMPSLHCKFSKAGRRDDPTKLHFASAEERTAFKDALVAARDEAARE
jgi:hypothetical protein